jgi:YHS domain-containing protein
MNSIQQVDPARVSAKTQYILAAKCKTLPQPRMKHSFIVFALWALTAYYGSAAVTNFPSHRAARDLKTFNPGMRVWVEKGIRKVNVDSNGVILKGYDPVAYFTQNKAVKGSSKHQSTYQGATYYFSSAADLATFKRNPSKYVPQYGGFCADGMRKKQENDIDPTVFFIVKGKLYVCESPAAEKAFRAHEDEDIITANRNWYQMFH